MEAKVKDKFINYLVKKKQPENIAEFVENELGQYIRDYLDLYFEGVDSCTTASYYSNLRMSLQTHTAAKRADEDINGILSLSLKWYALFLDSKDFKGRPKIVLGEREKAGCNEAAHEPDVAAEPTVKHDELVPVDGQLTEGKLTQVSITKHERNPNLRQACLQAYGDKAYTCAVCGMDFASVYGEIGKEYIEIHHLTPISTIEDEHEVDPGKDLVPLCSNCHSMIHRGGKDGIPLTIDALNRLYNEHK